MWKIELQTSRTFRSRDKVDQRTWKSEKELSGERRSSLKSASTEKNVRKTKKSACWGESECESASGVHESSRRIKGMRARIWPLDKKRFTFLSQRQIRLRCAWVLSVRALPLPPSLTTSRVSSGSLSPPPLLLSYQLGYFWSKILKLCTPLSISYPILLVLGFFVTSYKLRWWNDDIDYFYWKF